MTRHAKGLSARFTTAALASVATFAIVTFASPAAKALPLDFSAAGADPAAILDTVNAFRAALGDNNGNLAGSQGAGRREINWDGGGAAAPAAVFGIPMTTFAFRGNVYTTPGTGFEISGQPTPEFGDINAGYPNQFQPFSNTRLFAPLGANVMDVHFTIPGTTDEQALTKGFGVVFTDVDLVATTSIEFFDIFGASLGLVYAEAFDKGLSFLGRIFDDAVVARARITTGNAIFGLDDGFFDSGFVDVVAMDDFIYGEPLLPVPEPALAGLFGVAVIGTLIRRRAKTAA